MAQQNHLEGHAKSPRGGVFHPVARKTFPACFCRGTGCRFAFMAYSSPLPAFVPSHPFLPGTLRHAEIRPCQGRGWEAGILCRGSVSCRSLSSGIIITK